MKKQTLAETNRTSLTKAHLQFSHDLNVYASFKVSNSALSEDLVQDTYIKTWAYLVKGGEIVKMKAFLYHVLNGLIIDEYRKHKSSSLDALIEKGFDARDDSAARTLEIFDGQIAVSLIDKLPRHYQTVMRMRYVEGLSLAEIALLTGKSKSTTAVHAHRGLEKLRVLYGHSKNPIFT
jgi:RNA polymerase sigma-70 factor, ECF subfamily